MTRLLVMIVVFGVLLGGCSAPGLTAATHPSLGGAATVPTVVPTPRIRVLDAWARRSAGSTVSGNAGSAMPGAGVATGAIYFVLANEGGTGDALIGARVTSDLAQAAEIHETTVKGGVATMRPIARVVVPANGQVTFKPGGYHVMLIGLKHELRAGDRVHLTLQFEASGELPVEAEVRANQ